MCRAAATRGNGGAPARKTGAKTARSPRRPASAKKSKSNKESKKESKGGSAPLPDFVPPSLATLRTAAPNGRGLGP